MKTGSTQQEVLLFTGTSFSRRELSDMNGQENNRLFKSAKEQWKEGCWNGVLSGVLPEIFEQPGINRKMFLWNVYEGQSFLGLEMGEQMTEPEEQFSINPASFSHANHAN